jgi:hypothetical protein
MNRFSSKEVDLQCLLAQQIRFAAEHLLPFHKGTVLLGAVPAQAGY